MSERGARGSPPGGFRQAAHARLLRPMCGLWSPTGRTTCFKDVRHVADHVGVDHDPPGGSEGFELEWWPGADEAWLL